MKTLRAPSVWSSLAVLAFAATPVMSQHPESDPLAVQGRLPTRFGIIFNMGYGGDHLPKDVKAFGKLIQGIKRAHFNVVLCEWTPARARICKKHDVEIMVDLLTPPHHIYKNVEGAEALCRRLEKVPGIYAYHLWSDNIGNTYPGRSRDVKSVRSWDGKHPVYVGSYRMSRVNRVVGLDLLGYYDFHWKRAGHWGNLAKASRVAKGKDARFLRYCAASPGQIGKGNKYRVAYTIATSIPFGLKGFMYHYAGGVVDTKTGKLDTLGEDLRTVHANFAAIGAELMRLGNPEAVFSTPVTRTSKDKPVDGPAAIPSGLAGIPSGHWFQIDEGEVLVGSFGDKSGARTLALASHNAYQPQTVVLRLDSTATTASHFDSKRGKWRPLKLRQGRLTIQVPASTTQLLRL